MIDKSLLRPPYNTTHTTSLFSLHPQAHPFQRFAGSRTVLGYSLTNQSSLWQKMALLWLALHLPVTAGTSSVWPAMMQALLSGRPGWKCMVRSYQFHLYSKLKTIKCLNKGTSRWCLSPVLLQFPLRSRMMDSIWTWQSPWSSHSLWAAMSLVSPPPQSPGLKTGRMWVTYQAFKYAS